MKGRDFPGLFFTGMRRLFFKIQVLMSARMLFPALRSLSFHGALVAVALAPLPFGMVDLAHLTVYLAAIGVSLALALSCPLPRLRLGEFYRIVGGLIILCLLYVAIAYLQESTSGLVTADPMWKEAGELLGKPLPERLTIVAGRPLQSLAAPLAMMATFLIFYIHGQDLPFRTKTLTVLAWLGLIYGTYSALSLVIDPSALLWRTKVVYLSNLTGTFVNRNTAATYFGTCMILFELALLQAVKRLLGNDPMSLSTILALLSERVRMAVIAPLAGLILCLTFTLMTGSRAGSLLTLFAGAVLFSLFTAKRFQRQMTYKEIIAIIAPVAILFLAMAGSALTNRLERQGFDDEARFTLYGIVVHMIAAHPWLGTGLGTFADAIPLYRSDALPSMVTWDKAHNTLLELASDGGIPLAVAVAAYFLMCGTILWRRIGFGSAIEADSAMAALAIGLLACLHSLVDFSLQIPGYANVFAAIMGVVMAGLNPEDAQSRQFNHAAGKHRRRRGTRVSH